MTEPSRVRAEILARLIDASTQWDERTGDEPTSQPYLEYLAESVEDLWDTWHHEVVIPLRNDVAALRQQVVQEVTEIIAGPTTGDRMAGVHRVLVLEGWRKIAEQVISAVQASRHCTELEPLVDAGEA
jgi:hypothetical protein